MARKILLVDDIKTNRLILTEMLHKDYEILEAANGEEALAILSRNQETVSAVLLDIVMPGMDGYEVLRRIRSKQQLSLLPVIMITGSEDEDSRVKALSLGANDYVMKPYSVKIIKHCLQNNIALREASETVNLLERDRLTGIWNREAFFARAARQLEKAPEDIFVLGCLDIEGFKVINDQYGNDMGDLILKTIADALQESCSERGGLCGRIAADQFVSLFSLSLLKHNSIGPEPLEARVLAKTGVRLTIRVGRYIIEDKSLSTNAMFDRASIAKSTIKGRYDTHVAVYDESMRDKILHEQTIVNEMNAALDGKQFEVWFQPQYNRATDALIGAEALVRWRHPQNGLIAPNVFIPIFEKNGFIYNLDKFVWTEACRYLRQWIDEGRSPLPVSVNISRYDVLRPDLIETITGIINSFALPRDLLRLEITESAFSHSAQLIVNVVRELIELGFTVEIDDFGSGFSSLNTLKDVPAQIIKLDMKFLESSSDSQRGGSIVESVVRMAKWLGVSVIAEGVETVEQADFLRSIGCNYMQGYLYARPMPAAQYEEHFQDAGKEEHLLALETVEHLDNNAFWNPQSMDTLIFNSYVGAACIFEFSNDKIEVIRSTDRFAEMISGAVMSVEDTLKLDWSAYLDADNKKRLKESIQRSKEINADITTEFLFIGLPGCPEKTYIRATIRAIATAGSRCLVYNLVENITGRREAEQRILNTDKQLHFLNDIAGDLLSQPDSEVAIDRVLHKILEHFGADRTNIFEQDKNNRTASCTYEVCSPGQENSKVRLQNTADADYAMWLAAFAENSFLEILDAAALPETRAVEKEMLRARGVNTLIAAPFFRDGKFVGFISIENPTLGLEQLEQLRVLGDYLAVILTRRDLMNKIREDSEAMQTLMDDTPGGFALMQLMPEGNLATLYVNDGLCRLRKMTRAQLLAAEGENAVANLHPDDLPQVNDAVNNALATGNTIRLQYRLRGGDGEYTWFSVFGRQTKGAKGELLVHIYYAELSEQEKKDLTMRETMPFILSAIMDSSPDLAFAKDKDFNYLCCSPGFVKFTRQKTEADVIGKNDYDFWTKEEADRFRSDDIRLFEGGESLIDFTEPIPSDDGIQHYSITSKYILRDSTGEIIGLYGVGRDVTDTRTALERLQLVTDSIPGGIATYAINNNGIRITYCNDGFCRLFGGTREGLLRRGALNPIDWVHKNDRAQLLAQIYALVEHDTPLDCVYRVQVVGGDYKWINEKAVASERQGDTVFFNAMLLDVTERQLINEQLRISEEENNFAVQHGGSIVSRYDVAAKSLTIAPSVAVKYSLPAQIDNVPYEPVRLGLISPETADAYISFFESILNGKKAGTVLFQQRYLGEWRWMEGKSSTIFSDDDKPVKAVISLFDVTERLEKEKIYKKWQHSLDDRAPDSYTLFRCNLNRNESYETKEGTLFFFDVDGVGFSFNERAKAYAAQCLHEEDRDKYTEFLNADTMLADYYRGKRSGTLDYRERTPDGGLRWLRLTVDLVESPNSTAVEAYLMYENIDETKKTELQTKELSETDPLTGILNRTTFAAKVNALLQTAQPETRCALLMLDLDSFKQVNDVFGHGAGDQTLIDLAHGLRSLLRQDDLAARLGGDEFMVFLTDVLNTTAVIDKACQIRALARKSFSLEVQISASVGIAFSPHDGLDFETLYKKADSALYYVKGSGKDNQAIYSDNMADEHLEPEPDTMASDGTKLAEKKRRMLIVDDNSIDHALLQNIFRNEFIIEKAKDGNSALIRLRHYGSAISVVLLDLIMPGMDGFAVLEKMQENVELAAIPVIMVSGDESRETCLTAIRKGATDFVTKPVDAAVLRIRVHSAISKAENERLRARNNLLEVQSKEQRRYEAFLENPGTTFIEYNWLSGDFTYYPSIANCLWGTYDGRILWQILLSDMVADTKTVQQLQQLVHQLAEDRNETSCMKTVKLKTPQKVLHNFRFYGRKIVNEYQLTNKIVITLTDLDYEAHSAPTAQL